MGEALVRRKVVLGVTGSIAAYKAAEFARLLVSRGYTVRTVMSEAAQEFVSPLTFESITGEPVTTDFWSESQPGAISHIDLADWADAVVIAPATADTIAKLAHGFADNPLNTLALATRAPILIAPAMNVNMYENEVTQRNINELRERGVEFVDPENGALACGWNGTGRLADPWEIFYHTLRALASDDLRGRRVLITTGPTREPVDPIRFLSNRSSGKMGVALAREAFRRGAEVTLVHGPVRARVPSPVRTQRVFTAQEMCDAVLEHAWPEDGEGPDIIIMAAAVADFRPASYSATKIKKLSKAPTAIKLENNPDILMELGARRGDASRPLLVGFAVETGEVEEMIEELGEKLKRKQVDMIIGNLAEDAFDSETNRVWIIDRHGKTSEIATSYKSRVANKILSRVSKL